VITRNKQALGKSSDVTNERSHIGIAYLLLQIKSGGYFLKAIALKPAWSSLSKFPAKTTLLSRSALLQDCGCFYGSWAAVSDHGSLPIFWVKASSFSRSSNHKHAQKQVLRLLSPFAVRSGSFTWSTTRRRMHLVNNLERFRFGSTQVTNWLMSNATFLLTSRTNKCET